MKPKTKVVIGTMGMCGYILFMLLGCHMIQTASGDWNVVWGMIIVVGSSLGGMVLAVQVRTVIRKTRIVAGVESPKEYIEILKRMPDVEAWESLSYICDNCGTKYFISETGICGQCKVKMREMKVSKIIIFHGENSE